MFAMRNASGSVEPPRWHHHEGREQHEKREKDQLRYEEGSDAADNLPQINA
jgi:hypothetical protein